MLSTKTTSRRAVMTGVSAASVAVPVSVKAATDDPIFALIEQHKVAYRTSQEIGRVKCKMVDWSSSPEYNPILCKAVNEAANAAHDAANNAGMALATIRPTTIAGLLALMRYVEAFNNGAFVLDENWYSCPVTWPSMFDDDGINLFGYKLLANVCAALAEMAVQS
jgi:hypothetical protein